MKMFRFSQGVMRMDRNKDQHIKGTARPRHVVREARVRWFGLMKRSDHEYIGKRMLEMEKESKIKEQISGCSDRRRCRRRGMMETDYLPPLKGKAD